MTKLIRAQELNLKFEAYDRCSKELRKLIREDIELDEATRNIRRIYNEIRNELDRLKLNQ